VVFVILNPIYRMKDHVLIQVKRFFSRQAGISLSGGASQTGMTNDEI
jgi:hypothetical protein